MLDRLIVSLLNLVDGLLPKKKCQHRFYGLSRKHEETEFTCVICGEKTYE